MRWQITCIVQLLIEANLFQNIMADKAVWRLNEYSLHIPFVLQNNNNHVRTYVTTPNDVHTYDLVALGWSMVL